MKNYFEKLNKRVEGLAIKADITIRKGVNTLKNTLDNNNGWGKDEIISIAAALIIAAFIIIPGLRELATTILSEAKTWFSTKIKIKIFQES